MEWDGNPHCSIIFSFNSYWKQTVVVMKMMLKWSGVQCNELFHANFKSLTYIARVLKM
jgi:hypothetical protein